MDKTNSMDGKWYVMKGSNHFGPYDEDQLYKMYHQGRLNSDSLLWSDGVENWMPLKDAPVFDVISGKDSKKAYEFALPRHLKDQRTRLTEIETDIRIPQPDLLTIEEVPDIPKPPASLAPLMSDQLNEVYAEELETIPEDLYIVEDESDLDIADVSLPPLPEVETEGLNAATVESAEVEQQESELPPEFNQVDEEVGQEETTVKLSPEEPNEGLDEAQPAAEETTDSASFMKDVVVKKKRNGFFSKFIAASFILSLLIGGPLAWMELRPVDYPNLPAQKLKRLKDIRNTGKVARAKMGMTMESPSSIWVALNSPHEYRVFMTFELEKSVAPVKEKIIASARAVSKNGLFKVDKLIYNEGKKLVPGLYKVNIRGFSQGTMSFVTNILSNLDFLNRFKLFRSFHTSFHIEKKFFLTPENEKDFAAKLKGAIKARDKAQAKAKFDKPRMESIKTLIGMTKRVKDLHAVNSRKKPSKSSSATFERIYAHEIAPVLQGMMVGQVGKVNVKSLKPQKETDAEIQSVSRLLGRTVVQVSESLEVGTSLKKRRALNNNISESLAEIQIRLNQLQEKLKEL